MRLGYVLLLCCVLVGCGSAEPRASIGPKLYLAGDNELWIVDADSGRVWHRFSSQLGPGDPPHKVLARGRRVVMGRPYGDRAFFLPSARRDRVWVVDLRSFSGTAFAVREVTVDGETTVPRGAPEPALAAGRRARRPAAGGQRTGRGLGSADRPRRESPGRPPGLLGPAGGDVVTACVDAYCPVLRMIDVGSGRVRVARAPSGRRSSRGAACSRPTAARSRCRSAAPASRGTAPRSLGLIDVATGRVAIVPRSEVAAGYNLVAWSADGPHVFITGGSRGGRRERRLPARDARGGAPALDVQRRRLLRLRAMRRASGPGDRRRAITASSACGALDDYPAAGAGTVRHRAGHAACVGGRTRGQCVRR